MSITHNGTGYLTNLEEIHITEYFKRFETINSNNDLVRSFGCLYIYKYIHMFDKYLTDLLTYGM